MKPDFFRPADWSVWPHNSLIDDEDADEPLSSFSFASFFFFCVFFFTSFLTKPDIRLLSGYSSVIILLLSGYRTVIVWLSSSYHLVIIQLLSG